MPHPFISFLQSLEALKPYISYNVSLEKKTSFHCVSIAAAYFKPQDQKTLAFFLDLTCKEGFAYQKDFHVLGKGSNVLFEDDGYAGCIMDLSSLNQIQDIQRGQSLALRVEAGVSMGMLLGQLRKQSYTGFEFVFGIPGSIGGGIRMNAGTPDGWFSEVLTKVYGFKADGTPFEKEVSESDFTYRNFPWGADKIITAGDFIFQKAQSSDIEEKIARAKEKRDRQPLTFPNFGSVFKNPKPAFAGALVEEVGLKGTQIGQAQISEKHANFMINHGKAKTQDVKKLIQLSQQKVFDETGISLETEVHILGETNES